jgi:hypothetical protein
MGLKREKLEQVVIRNSEITTIDIIELYIPTKKQKLIITVTKRHSYDKEKKKIVTDQTIHRARYSLSADKQGQRNDLQGA